MSLMRTTQPKHDTHVAPLGLGGLGVPIVYKHVAPLVLKTDGQGKLLAPAGR